MSSPILSSLKSYPYFRVAKYDGVEITNNNLARKSGTTALFDTKDIIWKYFRESSTTGQDPDLGAVKYWDIVVKESSVLKDAAWMYVDPPADALAVKDTVCLRIFKCGDSGFGLHPTGETDGVDVDESWFG